MVDSGNIIPVKEEEVSKEPEKEDDFSDFYEDEKIRKPKGKKLHKFRKNAF